jgi:hypothetical protein
MYLPDANPWKPNWKQHVFISVPQDGLRWRLTAATEQVRSWPLVFTSFPIHHFTPRAFQEINMCLVCSRAEKDLWRKNHPVNIYHMNSEKILSVLGYWWCIFDLVVALKISFIPTIEFPYSTGGPLLIMSSPTLWKKSFFGCCAVAREHSEHWIAIWPAEFSLNGLQSAMYNFSFLNVSKSVWFRNSSEYFRKQFQKRFCVMSEKCEWGSAPICLEVALSQDRISASPPQVDRCSALRTVCSIRPRNQKQQSLETGHCALQGTIARSMYRRLECQKRGLMRFTNLFKSARWFPFLHAFFWNHGAEMCLLLSLVCR